MAFSNIQYLHPTDQMSKICMIRFYETAKTVGTEVFQNTHSLLE